MTANILQQFFVDDGFYFVPAGDNPFEFLLVSSFRRQAGSPAATLRPSSPHSFGLADARGVVLMA